MKDTHVSLALIKHLDRIYFVILEGSWSQSADSPFLVAARVNHGAVGLAHSRGNEVCMRGREVSYAEKGTEAAIARDSV